MLIDKDGCCLQATGTMNDEKSDDNVISGSINSIAMGAESLAGLLGISKEA